MSVAADSVTSFILSAGAVMSEAAAGAAARLRLRLRLAAPTSPPLQECSICAGLLDLGETSNSKAVPGATYLPETTDGGGRRAARQDVDRCPHSGKKVDVWRQE